MEAATRRRVGNAVAAALAAGWIAAATLVGCVRTPELVPDADRPITVEPREGEYRGQSPWDVERATRSGVGESAIASPDPWAG